MPEKRLITAVDRPTTRKITATEQLPSQRKITAKRIPKIETFDTKEEKLEEAAKALDDLFREVEISGDNLETEMNKPSERSEDSWGLHRTADGYISTQSIMIVEDEFGNETITIT